MIAASAVPVLLDLPVQVGQVDVAVVVAGHHDHPHARPSPRWPRWCRARWTGSGRRRGAPRPARGGTRGSPAARPAHPASRRWAARSPRRSRSARPASPPAGRSASRSPAVCAAGANGWMSANSRPGDRLHLGGGVELHRARAERDHAAVQRVVHVGQPAQVAQHRRLGAVRVEHRVRQEVACAAQRAGSAVGGQLGPRPGTPNAASTARTCVRPWSSRRRRRRPGRRRPVAG